MAEALPTDPNVLLRSREYRALLVLAALLGIVVSAASWGFLELVHGLQTFVYERLPGEVGFDDVPVWWPLPWVALAGLVTGLAIQRLPGSGGHVPADGLKTGGAPTRPIDLPGVLIAASATLGLGLVLGPEGPLIALGMGLGVLAMQRVRKDAPGQAVTLMAAAGSFAAVATIFGSPVIGAVLIVEAAGLGGAMLPLVLLPGLLAAGIGSLMFIGLGSWTGLSTAAWQLSPFPLPDYGGPQLGEFGWTLVLSIAVAVIVFGIMEIGRNTARLVARRRVTLTVAAGVGVGLLSIVYELTTDAPGNAVLFSGQEAFGQLFAEAPTLATSTLVGLFALKALAWGLSLGAFRGGPTFPAIFLGVVAGLVLGDLPGYAETPAVATLVGATCVSVLRLPLSSTMIALLLCAGTGLEVAPLVIVGVVAAYITSLSLSAFVDRRIGAGPAPVADGAAAAPSAGG